MAKEVDLVRQADERAARAFRAVLEWRRDAPAGGDETKPVDGGERL
jgi:Xaa-Pro aminopeptidase